LKAEFFKRILHFPNRLFKTIRIRSIQFVITASFTVITILGMLYVGITLYNKFSVTAEQNASITTRQIIEQVSFNLDYYLKSMLEISDYINMRVYIDQYEPDARFSDQLDMFLKTRKDIVNLAVFSSTGELIVAAPAGNLKKDANVLEQSWFKIAMGKPNTYFFSLPHVQNLFKSQYNWVVSLSRNITFYRMDEGVHGVLLVDMNFKAIDDLCGKVNMGKKGCIYIIDSYGSIIYHPQQQLIYAGLKEENTYDVLKHLDGSYIENSGSRKRMVTIKTVNYTGWKIVGVSDIDEIVTINREIGKSVIIILMFGILFVTFISAFISKKISQPVKMLEKSMKMVENGQFDINIDIKGEDEVVRLAQTFKLMVVKIRSLMEQILVEQEEKRKSELDALQAQINPHFLYNTLDSIVWTAESGEIRDAIAMVNALAKFFRISISKGRNIITMQEELEHARNYLIIQKIRYKGRFKFEFETQEEALQCKTLKLILQPIIENSLYHGFEYMVDEGFIKISTGIVSDKLLVRIRDNGMGIVPDRLENILTDDAKPTKGSGVGVKNVHRRIQLYFGCEYGLQIESKLEFGTDVKIWLPVVKE